MPACSSKGLNSEGLGHTSMMPENRDLCLHVAQDINMGSGLTPR